MKKFIFIFLFFLSANASSFDELEKISEQQEFLFEIRKLSFDEHYQRYELQKQTLKTNLSILFESSNTESMFYYKESENMNINSLSTVH